MRKAKLIVCPPKNRRKNSRIRIDISSQIIRSKDVWAKWRKLMKPIKLMKIRQLIKADPLSHPRFATLKKTFSNQNLTMWNRHKLIPRKPWTSPSNFRLLSTIDLLWMTHHIKLNFLTKKLYQFPNYLKKWRNFQSSANEMTRRKELFLGWNSCIYDQIYISST